MISLDEHEHDRPHPIAKPTKLRVSEVRTRLQGWDDTVDPFAATPLHAQVLAIVVRHVTSGELAPGDFLSPEKDLAFRLGVSRPTVRHAYADLAVDGWLTRPPGRGTILTPASAQPSLVVDPRDSLSAVLEEQGDARVERREEHPPFSITPENAAFFGDVPIALRREEVGSVGGTPVGYCSTWCTASPDAGVVGWSEGAVRPREKTDQPRCRALPSQCATGRASRVHAVEAQLLNIPLGSPLLEMHTWHRAAELPVSYVLTRWRADMVAVPATCAA